MLWPLSGLSDEFICNEICRWDNTNVCKIMIILSFLTRSKTHNGHIHHCEWTVFRLFGTKFNQVFCAPYYFIFNFAWMVWRLLSSSHASSYGNLAALRRELQHLWEDLVVLSDQGDQGRRPHRGDVLVTVPVQISLPFVISSLSCLYLCQALWSSHSFVCRLIMHRMKAFESQPIRNKHRKIAWIRRYRCRPFPQGYGDGNGVVSSL